MESARESTLQAQFALLDAPLRPIMTSLNGDNSWLLSFPRPVPEQQETGKAYYHIVIEPWLNGPTTQFSSFLIHIKLQKPAELPDAESVAAVARQIETAAARNANLTVGKKDDKYSGDIDAIFLGFHYLDHVHEPTLRLFDSRIPVIATAEAAAIIKPWKHFTNIHLLPSLIVSAKSWRTSDLYPGCFPRWLTAIQLPGHHELNYITAFIWTHLDKYGSDIHETILQSPHGSRLDEGPLEAFLNTKPETETLALLHGLHESRAVGTITTMGAEGGLALYRKIGGAKYWVLSTDGALQYSGFIMRAIGVYDTPRTLEWALEKESKNCDRGEYLYRKPNLIKIDNGGCFVLE
jgi:hypothetical protein